MLLLVNELRGLANLSMKRLRVHLRWQFAGLVSLGERHTIDFRAILVSLDIRECPRQHLISCGHVRIDSIVCRWLVPRFVLNEFWS